jgi:hypothetical protein
MDANQQHFCGLTDEQKALAPDWLARVLEIRKIGHQLNGEGGVPCSGWASATRGG